MVIIFDNKKARKFLVEHGYVYTLRRVRRKKEGKDWCNYFRTDTKKHNVWIEYQGFIEFDSILGVYADESGFDTLEEWLKAAKGSRFLYLVSIRPHDDSLMLVKRKELLKFFDIADTYFCSYGGMIEKNYKFVDYFIEKYKLEEPE